MTTIPIDISQLDKSTMLTELQRIADAQLNADQRLVIETALVTVDYLKQKYPDMRLSELELSHVVDEYFDDIGITEVAGDPAL